jgi:hypothetical protein
MKVQQTTTTIKETSKETAQSLGERMNRTDDEDKIDETTFSKEEALKLGWEDVAWDESADITYSTEVIKLMGWEDVDWNEVERQCQSTSTH